MMNEDKRWANTPALRKQHHANNRGNEMTERQKQHQGRSASDDTELEGRDIKADALEGTGNQRVSGAFEGGKEKSDAALHIEELLKKEKDSHADNAE